MGTTILGLIGMLVSFVIGHAVGRVRERISMKEEIAAVEEVLSQIRRDQDGEK